jgi:hypothetical protein
MPVTFSIPAYYLDLQITSKSQGYKIKRKGLSQTDYSIQHIEGYDLLCYKEKIYIPQSLRQRILFWYHEYLLHPG